LLVAVSFSDKVDNLSQKKQQNQFCCWRMQQLMLRDVIYKVSYRVTRPFDGTTYKQICRKQPIKLLIPYKK